MSLLFYALFEMLVEPLAFFVGALFLKIISLGRINVGKFQYCNVSSKYEKRKKAIEESGLNYVEFEKMRSASARTLFVGLLIVFSPLIALIIFIIVHSFV